MRLLPALARLTASTRLLGLDLGLLVLHESGRGRCIEPRGTGTISRVDIALRRMSPSRKKERYYRQLARLKAGTEERTLPMFVDLSVN
jgi:hypothetical protein